MFTNAKSVKLNGKEVKKIVLDNGGVLYNSFQPLLTLESSPSTVYYGDTVNLTATLTNHDKPISGETISFVSENAIKTHTINSSGTYDFGDYFVINCENVQPISDFAVSIKIGDSSNLSNLVTIDFHEGEDFGICVNVNGSGYCQCDSTITIKNGILTVYQKSSSKYRQFDVSNIDLTQWTCVSISDNIIVDEYFYTNSVTNSNGIASSSILCQDFASANIIANYGDLSDNVNIIVNDKYDLDLVSDKDILSYNDNDIATLTATLTKNNIGLANETISFTNTHNKLMSSSAQYMILGDKWELDAAHVCIIQGQINTEKTVMQIYDSSINIWQPFKGKESLLNTSIMPNSIISYDNGILYYYDTNGIKQSYDISIVNSTYTNMSNKSHTIKSNILSLITDSNGQCNISYDSHGIGDITFTANCLERNFVSEIYAIEDCTYWNDTEVTRTSRNGSTIYDNNMSIALPSNCEICFDIWSDNPNTSGEHRFFLMPKSQWNSGTTQPQYGLYIDQVGGNKGRLGQRNNNATYDFINRYSLTGSSYHTLKIIKTNNSLDFYIDDELKTTQTLDWIGNYSDYCVSMMRWTSSGTSKIKNVKIKPL